MSVVGAWGCSWGTPKAQPGLQGLCTPQPNNPCGGGLRAGLTALLAPQAGAGPAAGEPPSRSTEQPRGQQEGAEARLSPRALGGGTGAGPFLSPLPSLRGRRRNNGAQRRGMRGGLWKAGGATGTASFPAAFPLAQTLPSAGELEGRGSGSALLGKQGSPQPPGSMRGTQGLRC